VDASKTSGIYHLFSTAGSAWGDVNGDGWPDLWVSNHWHQAPSLYLNQKDGTFVDIAAETVSADLPADFHGAAWADFDNDGDMDLFVTTGGGAGKGTCPNYLFVNQDGKLRDQAVHYKLDNPYGRGRTPLWFDADRDGRLDLLVMNRFRKGGQAPSAVFLQSENGFTPRNKKLGFNPSGKRSWSERGTDLLHNASHFNFRTGPGEIKPAEVFAQLADLTGNDQVDLISYTKPMRAYAIGAIPFDEITNQLGFSDVNHVQDAAVEDFDGDGWTDMFLVRSVSGAGFVVQTDPTTVKGKMKASKGGEPVEIQVRTAGDLTFTLFTSWIDPTAPPQSLPLVAVGARASVPIDGEPISLTPDEATLGQAAGAPAGAGADIQFDPATGAWRLRSTLPVLHFLITSTRPVDDFQAIGFKSALGDRKDKLLVNGPKGLTVADDSGLSSQATACSSVAAGDFDNDMDLDLYLVCASSVHNLPNILYENDGKGRFTPVDDAGGAAGSDAGIGNQVATADYDRDGFLDLFVSNGGGQPPFSYQGPHQLFRNRGNGNHWIEIDLVGAVSNRDAVGALIDLQAGGVTQKRSQNGGIHSFSQNHQRLHFGLGPNTRVDRITVKWPSGQVTELEDVSADQILRISEAAPAARGSEIRFSDVSTAAGIRHGGTSYGASWGDLNGDGWPDLWVGNHNTTPTLYLNGKDGSFTDVIAQVWSGDPKADTHGAAWADFDNDGDQDLVELVDVKEQADGTFCVGCGKNHLYVNDAGKLWERSAQYGLDHTGHARSPLWFDADQDGLLDLLVVNMAGPNHPASNVYLQKDDRFVVANDTLGFKDGPMDRREQIGVRIARLMNFSYPSLAPFESHKFLESAQLADLSADAHSDLILFSTPSRVFGVNTIPFDNISTQIGLPALDQISDAAIADFNGDRRMDIYTVRGSRMPSDVIQPSPDEVRGRINTLGGGPPKAVRFKAQGEGDVALQVAPTWVPLESFFIGSKGQHPDSRQFTLSPHNADVHGLPAEAASASGGIAIGYDPESGLWTIQNFSRMSHVDFIAKATPSISNLETIDFKPFTPDGVDALLLRDEGGFTVKGQAGAAGEDTSCYLVAAADFDNDMDVDLYQTCTGPVANLPNRLLENDGSGGFRLVPDAGGAAGSPLGRGDAVAVADYDRDGFVDIFITNGRDPTSPFVVDGPHQLFRNQGNDNHWIEIDLEGVTSNRDGIGARVELETNGVVQVREQSGGMHRICQNHQRLHFGLAQHERVDRISVTWPSGIVQHLENVDADQLLHIKEAAPSAS
jgi:hypothetical protein